MPESDWNLGYLNNLLDDCPWVNCVILEPIDYREAWRCTAWRGPAQHSYTSYYVRFLDALNTWRVNNNIDVRAFPYMVSKLPGDASDIDYSSPTPLPLPYNLHSSGTWSTIPNDDELTFRNRVQALKDKPQLGGWILCNEPYGGVGAYIAGRRDAMHDQLQYMRSVIESEDNNLENHPFWGSFRGYGNYNFSPCSEPQYLFFLDSLSYVNDNYSLVDYMIDNLYNTIYAPSNLNEPINFAKCLTNLWGARNNLLSPICGAPSRPFGPIRGYLLKSQGMYDENTRDGYHIASPKQLRYVNYTSWINGAQGAIFHHLSKSDNVSYDNAYLVSEEASWYSRYLLEPDPGIEITLDCMYGNAQFIVRRDPLFIPNAQYREKILILVTNNFDAPQVIDIHFPLNYTIGMVELPRNTFEFQISWHTSDLITKIYGKWQSSAYFVYINN